MARRCVECQKYPWNPAIDPSMLPPAQCDSRLLPRKWTAQNAQSFNGCEFYAGAAKVEEKPAAPAKAPEKPTGQTIPEPVTEETGTYRELKEIAQGLEIEGVYKMSTKKDLVSAINAEIERRKGEAE